MRSETPRYIAEARRDPDSPAGWAGVRVYDELGRLRARIEITTDLYDGARDDLYVLALVDRVTRGRQRLTLVRGGHQ